MLKHRLITGPILIALLLGLVWLDETLAAGAHAPRGAVLFAIALVAAVAAALELDRVFAAHELRTRRWLTAAAAVTGLTLSFAVPASTGGVAAVAALASGMAGAFVAALLVFSHGRRVDGVVPAAGAVVFAFVYLGLLLGFLVAIRREHSAWTVVAVILTTKSCDIGAYFTGRAIGRRKLIPWLSPGKTWEGLVGGVLTSAVVAVAAVSLLPDLDASPLAAGLAGATFGLVGQLGDLAASLFKRGAGLKDSGRALPGLGGMLDVLDSPLMVAPVAFWLLHAA